VNLKNLSLVILAFALGGAQARADAQVTFASVDPADGAIQGGTKITITGTGFATDAMVKVDGYPCTDVAVASATKLTCKTPENIARKADLTVINGDGTSGMLAAAFRYKGTPTFQLLQKLAFTRFGVNAQGATVVYKCSGCHSGANPDGHLDTREYAQVLGQVVPNDPASSKMLRLVNDGKMPPSGRQPPLKDEEKQAISDWIADGARNN